ncbi:tetratricopeptide repeat protein [Candidatus Halobeggiatoa sp. HSG11]|nr:tetratricopeptide repeat protein [Candidatus Halobeggiatoa sp. HSG11]
MKILNKLKNKEKVDDLWGKIQTFSTNFLKVFLASLFLALIIHMSFEIFRYDLVIKPFEMPFKINRQGYTGTVVARKLQDEMDKIREEIYKSSSEGMMKGVVAAQFSELQKQQQIDIPTVGLSLNAIIHQLRKMLGMKQRSIRGDVVVKDKDFYLTLRITGKPVVNIGPVTDIDELIKLTAKKVINKLEPLTFGLNYYANYKLKELKILIAELRQVERFQKTKLSKKEEAIVLTLEGCLLAIQAKSDQNILNQALAKFAEAEKLSPIIKPTILRIKGNTYKSLKQYNTAIAAYKEALAIDSKHNGEVYVQWAITLIAQNKLAEAEVKFAEAAKNDPDNPWVYVAWGERLMVKLKKFTEAYQKFAIAEEKNPNYALNYAIWGQTLIADKKYSEAIEKFELALELNVNVIWVHREYGAILYEIGRYQEAANKLRQAVKLIPDRGSYYNLGKTLLKLNQYKQAAVQFQNAIKLDDKHVWSYNKLGYALLKLQKPQEAFTQCKTVLNLPELTNSQAAGAYAICGLAQLDQPQKAVNECKIALSLSEREDWGNWCLGDALMLLDKPVEAVAQYEAAIKLKPENSHYQDKLKQALAKLKLDSKENKVLPIIK